MSVQWHKIPPRALEAKAPIQLLELGGKRFCLLYQQGGWYATAAKCPHAGASLANGWCEDNQLVCPYHRQKFDLTTGKGAPGQHNFIAVYRLEERADGLYIALPQHWLRRLFPI